MRRLIEAWAALLLFHTLRTKFRTDFSVDTHRAADRKEFEDLPKPFPAPFGRWDRLLGRSMQLQKFELNFGATITDVGLLFDF